MAAFTESPLSPALLLEGSASAFADRVAIIDGSGATQRSREEFSRPYGTCSL